jgi:ADP-ribose pyrophosphatase
MVDKALVHAHETGDDKGHPMNPPSQRRVLFEGKFVRLLSADGWEWVERTNTSGAVVMFAITDDACLVLVEQYRIPLARRVVELPAGLVGDDPQYVEEALLAAAKRELLEETGYEAPQWKLLLEGVSSPGLTNESYTLFLATGARRVGPGGGDQFEDIGVHVVPLDRITAWLEKKRREGILLDPKIYMALYLAGTRQGG